MFKLISAIALVVAAAAIQKVKKPSDSYSYLPEGAAPQSRQLAAGDRYYWDSYYNACYNDYYDTKSGSNYKTYCD